MDLENANSIGENISELLYNQRKKQSWLAQQCGVTQSHISQIVKGKVNPSVSVLMMIASALDVTTDDITNTKITRSR